MASYPYPAQTPQDAKPRKSRRGRIILFVVIGLLVALLACAGIGYAVANRFGLLSGQRNTPALLPDSTQVYASINPNLSSLNGFRRLQTAYQQNDPNATADAEQQLEDLFGVNFKDDVQPWIGLEMAIAVGGIEDVQNLQSDLQTPADFAENIDATILLASRDNTKAQAFLDKVRAKQETDNNVTFEEQDYNGTTITVATSEGDEGLSGAYAIAKNFVVFANRPALIEEFIDRNGNEGTLAASPAYQQTLAGLPQNSVGHVYVGGDLLRGLATQGLEQQLEALPEGEGLRTQIERQRAFLDAFTGAAASITVPDDGVQFDTSIKFDLAKLDDQARAQLEATRVKLSDNLLKSIAKDTIGFYAVPIPDTFQQQMEDLLTSSPDVEQQVQSFEEQLNIDVREDLLKWISGEFAFVIMPGDPEAEGALADVPVSGYMVLRSKDTAAAEAGLQKIADALGKNGITFEAQDVGGQQWQAVSDPSSETVVGGYAIFNDAVVFGFTPAGMEAAAGANGASVVDDATYKVAQTKTSGDKGGLIYVDVQDVINVATEFQGQDRAEFDDTEAGKALKPIQSVIASGEPGVNTDGLARSRLFVSVAGQ